MKRDLLLFVVALMTLTGPPVWAAPATGGGHESLFDLEKEIITIPGTHDDPEPYRWRAVRHPADVAFALEREEGPPERPVFGLSLVSSGKVSIENVSVFVANRRLDAFKRIRPDSLGEGRYRFSYRPPRAGRYRFEVIADRGGDRLHFRKDLRLPAVPAAPGEDDRDRGYAVTLRTVPKRIYADHIGTFVFHFTKDGRPLRLEPMDGADLQAAAWNASMFSHMGEFQHGVPRQRLGGSEAAVSFVFEKGGTHRVFAEFRHDGVVRTVDTEVFVYVEPAH